MLGANDEARPPVKQRKTFCLVFSLQTGMSVIFLMDIFLLAFLCCNYGVNYIDGTEILTKGGFPAQGSGHVFNLMTDGLLIALYTVKVYYGWKYLY